MDNFVDFKLKKLDDNCILPAKKTSGAAGYDICACLPDGSIGLTPFGRVLVPTGFAIALNEGVEAQIRPRSGLAANYGITVLNSPGTIDSDFRGQVQVLLINLGQEDFEIKHGMRIAQMVIANVCDAKFTIINKLDDTIRGTGGFGSTGL